MGNLHVIYIKLWINREFRLFSYSNKAGPTCTSLCCQIPTSVWFYGFNGSENGKINVPVRTAWAVFSSARNGYWPWFSPDSFRCPGNCRSVTMERKWSVSRNGRFYGRGTIVNKECFLRKKKPVQWFLPKHFFSISTKNNDLNSKEIVGMNKKRKN